jgi:hypothetical protein
MNESTSSAAARSPHVPTGERTLAPCPRMSSAWTRKRSARDAFKALTFVTALASVVSLALVTAVSLVV